MSGAGARGEAGIPGRRPNKPWGPIPVLEQNGLVGKFTFPFPPIVRADRKAVFLSCT